MRPDARVQSAIDIVDQWNGSDVGLDRLLTDWGRVNRYAGSKDRAAIGDLVYGTVRRLRSANWVSGNEIKSSGRNSVIGALVLDGLDPEDFLTGERHAPQPLNATERDSIRDLQSAPRPIRLDYPDWLEPYVTDVDDADLDALRARAAVDLRVNTLKSDPEQAASSLAEEGISTLPVSGTKRSTFRMNWPSESGLCCWKCNC
ncbi:MAG: hypothetical protein AAF479_17685, partial [Pseudomonadota bacterium]